MENIFTQDIFNASTAWLTKWGKLNTHQTSADKKHKWQTHEKEDGKSAQGCGCGFSDKRPQWIYQVNNSIHIKKFLSVNPFVEPYTRQLSVPHGKQSTAPRQVLCTSRGKRMQFLMEGHSIARQFWSNDSSKQSSSSHCPSNEGLEKPCVMDMAQHSLTSKLKTSKPTLSELLSSHAKPPELKPTSWLSHPSSLSELFSSSSSSLPPSFQDKGILIWALLIQVNIPVTLAMANSPFLPQSSKSLLSSQSSTSLSSSWAPKSSSNLL